jgi:hypothetical protein
MSKNVPSCRNADQYSDPPDPFIASRKKKHNKNPHFCCHFLDDFFVTMPTLITAQTTTNAGGDCEFEQQQQQQQQLRRCCLLKFTTPMTQQRQQWGRSRSKTMVRSRNVARQLARILKKRKPKEYMVSGHAIVFDRLALPTLPEIRKIQVGRNHEKRVGVLQAWTSRLLWV